MAPTVLSDALHMAQTAMTFEGNLGHSYNAPKVVDCTFMARTSGITRPDLNFRTQAVGRGRPAGRPLVMKGKESMHLYTVISVCNGRTMIDGEWTHKTFVGTYGTFTSWKEADDKMGAEYESSINELLDYYGHDSETSNNIVKNSHREDGQAWVSLNGDDREVHYLVLSENDEQYLG